MRYSKYIEVDTSKWIHQVSLKLWDMSVGNNANKVSLSVIDGQIEKDPTKNSSYDSTNTKSENEFIN